MDQNDKKQHLVEIVKQFDTAMLTTQSQGGLRARPMSVAQAAEDGTVTFATSLDSPKVEELKKHPDVAVTMQGSLKYASLSGRATVSRDRARIDALWKETWKVFFPKGKDDPELCLVDVRPSEGEYWDNAGTQGVRYLIEAAKALVNGEKPKADGDVSGHVRM